MSTVIKKHFIGRDVKFKITQNITGLSTQTGTPSQSNYVEIVPVLVDPISGIDIHTWDLQGADGVNDSYDATTHKITRYYGRKVLTGTESYTWGNPSVSISWSGMPTLDTSAHPICTRLQGVNSFSSGDQITVYNATTLRLRMTGLTSATDAKDIIAAAYAEGKPFIVYYPLATPTTETAPPLIKTSIMERRIDAIPDEYERVEYIQSSGTQYINTGVKMSNSVSFLTSIRPTVQNKIGMKANSVGLIVWNVVSSQPVVTWRYKQVSGETLSLNTNYFYDVDHWYEVQYNVNNSFIINSFTTQKTIDISNNYSENILTGTDDSIKYLKIYDNNILVRNFVPVKKKSNDEYGLFDIVTQQFYNNAGTGSFSGGPTVKNIKQYIGETKTEVTN